MNGVRNRARSRSYMPHSSPDDFHDFAVSSVVRVRVSRVIHKLRCAGKNNRLWYVLRLLTDSAPFRGSLVGRLSCGQLDVGFERDRDVCLILFSFRNTFRGKRQSKEPTYKTVCLDNTLRRSANRHRPRHHQRPRDPSSRRGHLCFGQRKRTPGEYG